MNKYSIINLSPIGIVHSPRKDLEDDFWGGIISTIILDPSIMDITATNELDKFSHLEIIYYMHRVTPEKVINGARHPRNNMEFPNVGILAQRTKNRVNQLGLSRAKLLEVNGLEIIVEGLDAIDGTPILDIKPYMREFMPAEKTNQPDWVSDIMSDYYQVKK
jgi:tRNA-Thr(GGU) m(6)t(6)A37 methyltransferase TsaA